MNFLSLAVVLAMAALIGAGDAVSFFPTQSYEVAVSIASIACSLLLLVGYFLYFARSKLKRKIITDALLLALLGGISFFMIFTGFAGSAFTQYAGFPSSMYMTGKVELNSRSFNCSQFIRSKVAPNKYTNSKICVPKDFLAERGSVAQYKLVGRESQAGFVVDLISLEK